MKKTTIFTFLVFSLVCVFSHSQTISSTYSLKQVDSLLNYTRTNFEHLKITDVIQRVDKVINFSNAFDNSNKHRIKARAYNFLGYIHYSLGEAKEAEVNLNRAAKHANKIDHNVLKATINNNLGLLYVEDLGDIDKGIEKLKKSYSYASMEGDSIKSRTGLSLATAYILNNDYVKGKFFLEKSAPYIKTSTLAIDKAILYELYGKYYTHIEKYKEAEESFIKGIAIAKSNKSYKEAATLYKSYSKMLMASGQSKLAYKALEGHLDYKEKEINYLKESHYQIAKARFEVSNIKRELVIARNETSIEEEKFKQSRLITAGVICILILCITLFGPFIYNYKTKNRLGKSLKLKNEELEIARCKAEQVAELKTKFISTVSHELRTPLYGVIGLSTILLDRNKNKEDSEFLKLLKFSADHLLNLINDVLQITKMDSYEVKLHDTNVNIKNLVKNIKSSMEYQLGKNQNEFHLNFDETIPNMVIGDSVRLSQIIINLVSNASKFTDKGNVWLRLKNQHISDDAIEILFEVEDDGIGIALNKQEEIFENFSQVNVNNYEAGTGLGLSIVKKLLDLHDSSIALESIPGKGSKFSFVIKFDLEFSKSLNTLDKDFFIGDNSDYTILIVEDNKINQIVTKNVLKREHFKSEIANDGLEAVAMVKEKEYDLILMDLNMPNMDGIEATKIIREFNSHTPIVALTASETKETIKEVFNSGFNDFINKPYKDFEFFQRIKKNISFAMSEAS